MGQEDEFRIKGAAQKPDGTEQPPADAKNDPLNPAEKITDKAAEADQVSCCSPGDDSRAS